MTTDETGTWTWTVEPLYYSIVRLEVDVPQGYETRLMRRDRTTEGWEREAASRTGDPIAVSYVKSPIYRLDVRRRRQDPWTPIDVLDTSRVPYPDTSTDVSRHAGVVAGWRDVNVHLQELPEGPDFDSMGLQGAADYYDVDDDGNFDDAELNALERDLQAGRIPQGLAFRILIWSATN